MGRRPKIGENGPTGLGEYLLSQQGSLDLERSRLKLVQEYHDPLTAGQLQAIGVGATLAHASALPTAGATTTRGRGASWWGIAAIDPDFTTVAISPDTLTWNRTWSAFCDALVAGGWDYRYGAHLCDDLRAAGLVEVEADYVESCVAGGALVARLLSLTLERTRERLIAYGSDSEEIDEARRLLEDPKYTIRSPTTCVARARRPTGS